MKKVLFFLLFVLLVSASANPIAFNLFSELLFTDDGWQIEIKSISTWLVMWDSTAKFTLVFQSGNDTARYMDMSVFDDNFLVFTPEDLDTTLNLESFEDSLKVILLVNNETYVSDELSWGLDGVISAPLASQSICFGRTDFGYMGSDLTYYLDNSPTIGSINDTVGAHGRIEGYIIDPYGQPIADASIKFCNYGYTFFEIFSDSSGLFSSEPVSYKWQIQISKDGYKTQTLTQQIWPDSTIELNIVLKPKPEYYQSYFPLQVGNVWKYSQLYSSFSYTLSIDSVVTIGDYQYYKITENNYEKYLRYDSLGNVLIYQNGTDTSLYILSLGIQDSIQLSTGEYPVFVNVSIIDSMNLSIGSFENIISLYFWVEGIFDGEVELFFAKNVGLIEKTIWGTGPVQYQLSYAKVNGVEYPTSGIQSNPGQPEKYTLKLTNYPNPFNQSTTISYSLPMDGNIKLSVFDINGKCVDNLFTGKQRAGSYHFIWNGGNLSSGIYFIWIQSEKGTFSHKCLLVK